MNARAVAWALGTATRGSAKLVLVALAAEAGEMPAPVTVARLVAITGIAERTVQAALKALEAEGLIGRERRDGAATSYRCHICTPAESAPVQNSPSPTPANSAPPQVPHPTPAGSAGEGVQDLRGSEARGPSEQQPTSHGPFSKDRGEGVQDLRGRSGRRRGDYRGEDRDSPPLGRESLSPPPTPSPLGRGRPLAPYLGPRIPTPKAAWVPPAFPDEINGHKPSGVYEEVLRRLGVGDLRFANLPQVIIALLDEGVAPDLIYRCADRMRLSGGLNRARSAAYLASMVRESREGYAFQREMS